VTGALRLAEATLEPGREAPAPWQTYPEWRRERGVRGRVYMHAELGVTVELDRAGVAALRAVALEALREVGLEGHAPLRWDRKAGCGCGCSPGFVASGTRETGWSLYVDVEAAAPVSA
jgi:hypothetical protein